MSTTDGRNLATIILRNSAIATTGRIVQKVVNLAYMILVVRLLGETALGQYAIVVAFVGVFGIFFELGMSQYVQREIAQDRSQTAPLFWNLVALRLVLAITGCILLPGLALLMGYPSLISLGVALQAGTFLWSALLVPIRTVATAYERFDLVTQVDVAGQLLTVLLGLALLLLGQGFLALLVIGLVVMPLQVLVAVWLARPAGFGWFPVQFDRRAWRTIAVAGLPFGLTSLALMLNFSADTLILGLFREQAEVGWYNAAYRLVFSIEGLLGGFLAVLTPSLAREYVVSPERVAAWIRSAVRWLALFALPAAVGTSIVSSQIVNLLYGQAFEPSGYVLALICWDIPLLLITAFSGNVAMAVGLERTAARIYLTSVVLNIVLNLLLVPSFGMYGAAAVTLLTDGLSAAQFFVALCRHLGPLQVGAIVARTLTAAGLMGATIWLMRFLPLPFVVVAGTLSFGFFAMVLRLIDRSTLDCTVRHLRRAVSR